MKKTLIIIIALCPFITNCNKDNNVAPLMEIREIAWNQLEPSQKETIIINWNQAIVKETTYNETNAYSVIFSTKDNALLGPIIVYIGMKSKKYLGQGLRL